MTDFDNDDVPPLEDMTTVVERVKKMSMRENTNQSPTYNGGKHQKENQEVGKGDEKIGSEVDKAKPKKVFGGLQKGFLLGSSAPKKKSAPPRKPESNSISKFDYEVKPIQSQSSSLVLKDVQKAMEGSASQANPKWLNDDVLKKVGSDKQLLEQLSDPRFGEAIELMKTNPKEALERYKYDNEIAEFFKKFYGILGEHFSALAPTEKPDVVTPATQAPIEPHLMTQEEKDVQKILGNSELRTILEKPNILDLIKTLRENPDQAQAMLRSADMEMKADVRKLISAGLLNIQ